MSMRVSFALCALLPAVALGGIFHTFKAGPNLPQADIPGDLPPAVREKIVALYSKDKKVRAEAAVALGEMGSGAVGAIPYLVSMLDDDKGGVAIDRAQGLPFPEELCPFCLQQDLLNRRSPGDYAAIVRVVDIRDGVKGDDVSVCLGGRGRASQLRQLVRGQTGASAPTISHDAGRVAA